MSQIMDLLRGPAFGVILVIVLIAGVIIITAFAALVAQMGLLFRLKPAGLPGKSPEGSKEKENQRTDPDGSPANAEYQKHSCPNCQGSPQVVVIEPETEEVVEGIWWEVEST
jgi:hypothetical protein